MSLKKSLKSLDTGFYWTLQYWQFSCRFQEQEPLGNASLSSMKPLHMHFVGGNSPEQKWNVISKITHSNIEKFTRSSHPLTFSTLKFFASAARRKLVQNFMRSAACACCSKMFLHFTKNGIWELRLPILTNVRKMAPSEYPEMGNHKNENIKSSFLSKHHLKILIIKSNDF